MRRLRCTAELGGDARKDTIMTKYQNSECEEHRNVQISAPVCIVCMEKELAACAGALPGPLYMDPPDGGDAPLNEQLRRMAKDAARYRWLREHNEGSRDIYRTYGATALDKAIDAAIGSMRHNAELCGGPSGSSERTPG